MRSVSKMETAKLMNDFPWLVVREIYDYADNHKSKRGAAAYAEELL